MARTILLHLYWYLLVARVTHAEDLLVIFTLRVVTVGVAAIITVVAWYWSHWIVSDSDYF